MKILVILMVGFGVFPFSSKATDYYLYYLGGQSNMEGVSYIKDLPDSLKNPFKNVMIFHGSDEKDDTLVDGRGIWAPLQPGHGYMFKSDGKVNKYSSRFGCELSFADHLLDLDPTKKIAIIKYARSGTSLDSCAGKRYGCWEPDYIGKNGINQFDHFLATIKKAMSVKDIDGDGTEDHLIPCGIIWMQGEQDANINVVAATNYADNLARLMKEMRSVLGNENLPVVVGLITDSGIAKGKAVWLYGTIVQEQQRKFVEEDINAVLVDATLKYPFADKYHYTATGFIDLGIRFADAIVKMK